jgi:hypothetical protein
MVNFTVSEVLELPPAPSLQAVFYYPPLAFFGLP